MFPLSDTARETQPRARGLRPALIPFAADAEPGRREGDEYVLDGEKWHVTSANLADHCFFQAKLAEGPRAGGHAMFIVDLDAPGVEVVRTPAYSHTIAHHHPVLGFRGVRVPAANRVGEEGEGMRS